jgi:hypothetical protein
MRTRFRWYLVVISLAAVGLTVYEYNSMIRYAQFETGPCGTRAWDNPSKVFGRTFFLGEEVYEQPDLKKFFAGKNDYKEELIFAFREINPETIKNGVVIILDLPVMKRSKSSCEDWVELTGIDFRPGLKQPVSPSDIF